MIALRSFALFILLAGLVHPAVGATPGETGLVAGGSANGHETPVPSNATGSQAKRPLPVWFYGSTWYPYVIVDDATGDYVDTSKTPSPLISPATNSVSGSVPRTSARHDVPGKATYRDTASNPPKTVGLWHPGYALQGDFDAMFEPGARWNPSAIQVLVLDLTEISFNPKASTIVAWSNAHPNIKIAFNDGLIALGPDSGCVSQGGQNYPPKGTPLAANAEGMAFFQNFSQSRGDFNTAGINPLKKWKALGGRVDIILMDTPISNGVGRCSFTIPRLVSFMVPTAEQILKLYPTVQFDFQQGPTDWPDNQFVDYALQFFKEFPKQVINPVTHVGVPVSYADLDIDFVIDRNRKPPVPVYTTNGVAGTLNTVLPAFAAAGVGVSALIDAAQIKGETQAQYIARLITYRQQLLNSGLPLDHIIIQPFGGAHYIDWVLNNMPDTSPSALTWMLGH
ncbi:hypothetical protein [Acidisphaera sp. S103]|uniref:hypothetical protein n=1 Tax=Acidisphaera sp. S103 TaxID=1747223 RepID=UPI00131EBBDC|nr:hypothetical protein [Acidisphaera sp. S103]